MNGRGAGGQLGLLAVACLVVLTACRDNGLPDKNLPLDEARHREYGYPVYEAVPEDRPVAAGGVNWMPSLPVESISADVLVAVAGAGDTQLYSVRGAEMPYSRLYARVGDNQWRPYLRLD